MNIVAIIPARNEAETVADVVRVALSHPAISRVVVSDSASTDKTSLRAKEAGAEVVRVNVRGKGEAMSAATNYIKDATHFLFLDADLLNLTKESISSILALLPNADMGIGIQDRGWFFNSLSRRFLPWISGQRVVPRILWDTIPTELKTGYRIELSLNFIARKLGMSLKACTLDGVGALLQEEKKAGVAEGLVGRYDLSTQVISTFFLLRLMYWRDIRKDIKSVKNAIHETQEERAIIE